MKTCRSVTCHFVVKCEKTKNKLFNLDLIVGNAGDKEARGDPSELGLDQMLSQDRAGCCYSGFIKCCGTETWPAVTMSNTIGKV